MNNRLLELDALRGLAAIMVVLFHLFLNSGYSFFNFGVTGVNLFFLISGFVIFLTLSKITNWQSFVISRFTRLYPTYWACVSITAILVFVTTNITLPNLAKQYLANMTMFQHYAKIPHLDFQYWTLTVEMQFYALMLLLFLLKKLNNIETIGTIICFICLSYDTILQKHLPNIYHIINNAFVLINHFPLFVSGIVFYRLKFQGHTINRYLLLLLCFITQLFLFDNGGQSHGFISLNQYILLLVLYYALFFAYVKNKLNILVAKPLLFLGTISYPLYLIHQYLSIHILLPYLQLIIPNKIIVVFVSCIINLLLASIIYFYIEKPASPALKRYLLTKLNANIKAKNNHLHP